MKKIIYFLLAAMLYLPVNSQAQSAKGKIIYVLRTNYKDRETDEKVKQHIESLGYTVSFADESEPASKADGYDLVIISSTVSSQQLAGKYADVKIPVLMWENDILDDMRYTGKHKNVDFGEVEKEHYIWMVNAPHPLSGGIAAGMIAVYPKDQTMGWGKPGLGATIIATLPGQPDKAVIFGYEKGATMDYDFLAPARRVMIFLDNTTFTALNKNGLTLFDAAIKWAIERKGVN
ncbi:hypothetical protein [Chitinophaga sp. 212800010-3]|uniref:hypothetical protein n=1 Tax=unclassified Chitinophaga TaxID=2619133 RepID=UPI002DF42E20|nr:Signal peptide protein [Chitinophaga sp. 212800010-3]